MRNLLQAPAVFGSSSSSGGNDSISGHVPSRIMKRTLCNSAATLCTFSIPYASAENLSSICCCSCSHSFQPSVADVATSHRFSLHQTHLTDQHSTTFVIKRLLTSDPTKCACTAKCPCVAWQQCRALVQGRTKAV